MVVDIVKEKKQANLGVQENTLGLGKVAEYVEPAEKQSLAMYRRYKIKKNMNSLDILC